ncbi:MAG: signal peptidase I [Candidatus Aenigmatarchaeota archaeon]
MAKLKTWKKYKKKWDKFTDGWFGTIVYLFLGFAIAYMVNTGLGNLLNTNTPVVAVFSNSMVPTFYKGDMIIVQHVEEVAVGDIIVFSVKDRPYPIIHRVNEINADGIRTKGDNNLYVDPWIISQRDIYGRAILKFPLLGWVKIIFVDLTGLA